MNLQSPGPGSPKALQEVPMPALPMPPSPSMPKASMTLQTPKTAVNPRHISDASPMYDREAIARAMVRDGAARGNALAERDKRPLGSHAVLVYQS